jgi:hypothetical protein
MSRLSRTLAPAALVALIAGAATGQFIVESAPAAPTPGSAVTAPAGSVQTVVQIENGKRAELRLEEGVIVLARIDGKDWPRDRILREPDQVILLGADGAAVHRFSVVAPTPPTHPSAPAHLRVHVPGVPSVPAAPVAPGTPRLSATWSVEAPPPVMLGINFSEPGDALRAQLGLGETPAILVDGVIEGLPASKAGLKKHDIIVSINGSEGASGEILREALSTAKAEDTLALTLRRAGETVRVGVKLAAYDAARMGTSAPIIIQGQAEVNDPADLEDRLAGLIERYANDPENKEILAHLQALTTERAHRLARDLSDEARRLSATADAHGRAGLEAMQTEMQRKVEEAMRQAGRQMIELRDGRVFVRSGEGAARSLEELRDELAMRNSPAADARFEERIRAMEARMEAVERSFEERMDRLSALMERMADRLEADRERED